MRVVLVAAVCIAAQLQGQEIRLAAVIGASPDSLITDIQNAGDGSGRLFVVQQNGLIRILRNGVFDPAPFLNIGSRITSGGERGLLGLAFPPGFAQKQWFYIDYTDLNGDTVIARYAVSPNSGAADLSSEIVLLHIPQPFANHNGGQVRFGPDGYLYIGMGDGGSGGDPQGNGQNLGALLGKLLRIDVESRPGEVRIPADNPFIDTPSARPEIWAYGLRNPWRFSFDRVTKDLYIADVGQDQYEEVDYQPASSRGGENYGWNITEGGHCYASSACNTQGLTLPVAEYSHGSGCSVTGGFVYRGTVSPGLRGVYIFGDLCTGRIWGLQRQAGAWATRTLLPSGPGVTTFGEDESGEIYLGTSGGAIFHVVGSDAPRIEDGGVVNAASRAAGLVPGSIATVFVQGVLDEAGSVPATQIPLPVSLADVSVTVNGTSAPLFGVMNVNGSEQVNFAVPSGISTQQPASVTVSRAGKSSPAVSIPVLGLQPGIFTSDGAQALVVHNADYTLVTPERPLQPGEYAFVYAVGLGPVTNAPSDGAGGPFTPLAVAQSHVTVSLGGIPCEVPFVGLAPGLVGLFQINFKVPPASHGTQTLLLSADGVPAQPVQTTVQ